MTRHSTLTNPNHLHYAKIRVFTGNPTVITPDFADQILIAIDTKDIYLGTGANAGELLKLGGNTNENVSPVIKWIIVDQAITAESGKSYVKTIEAGIFLTLPSNPVDGDCIELFSWIGTGLNIDSNGKPLNLGFSSGGSTPWEESGILKTRFVPYTKTARLIFLGISWWLFSGVIETRDYIPVVFGCTDPEAANYDSSATDDDNSCYYN